MLIKPTFSITHNNIVSMKVISLLLLAPSFIKNVVSQPIYREAPTNLQILIVLYKAIEIAKQSIVCAYNYLNTEIISRSSLPSCQDEI